LQVHSERGTASSAEAVSIGLIVTELVINAFKHAFVADRSDGRLVVAYEASETSWKLAVSTAPPKEQIARFLHNRKDDGDWTTRTKPARVVL
jgi:two-component sensor histidine kinase